MMNTFGFKRYSPLILLVPFLLSIGCAGSRSRLKVGVTDEGEVVEAEGLAPYNSQDLIATKRASLADAHRNALEKAVGVYVSGKTMVEKAVAIENNILSRTDGYIKKFDVLSEERDGDLYKTKIRALVSLRDLESDLKELSLLNIPVLERPRVHIDLKEVIEKDESDEQAAKAALENSLSEAGYKIASSADASDTDLLLTGKVSSFPFQTTNLGGFLSYRARLVVQVTKPGSKEVITTYSKEASGLGGNKELAAMKSFEVVGQLAGEDLADKLSENWAGGGNLRINVENVSSFGEVEQIRKHIQSQPGVADLVLRLFEEGTVQFEVSLDKIKSQELASHLDKSASLPLSVVETTPSFIRLKKK